MSSKRIISLSFLLLIASFASAQGWSDNYTKALEALKSERWSDARNFFKRAASLRADDVSGPTTLKGGTATNPKVWRDGASYSPNFGAAYAAYKMALKTADDAERDELLKSATVDLKTLIKKNQFSKETFYFLNRAFTLLKDAEGLRNANDAYAKQKSKLNWKVDQDILTLEEIASLGGVIVTKQPQPTPEQTKPAETKPEEKTQPKQQTKNPTDPEVPKQTTPPKTQQKKPVKNPTDDGGPSIVTTPKSGGTVKPKGKKGGVTATEGTYNLNAEEKESEVIGKVQALPSKYALIIGNSETKIPNAAPAFAANDADYMSGVLTANAGYLPENITVIKNGSSEEIMKAAADIVAKMKEGESVFIFFAGAGFGVDGKDFLATKDTALATDSSTMVEKTALFQLFMTKGAQIFSFFECNRPIIGKNWFGKEVPVVGAISQMQATMPGGTVQASVKDGKELGLFVGAIDTVLTGFRSNRVPIQEFGWKVFESIKNGGTKAIGGSASQVPTLPVLTNLSPDSRF